MVVLGLEVVLLTWTGLDTFVKNKLLIGDVARVEVSSLLAFTVFDAIVFTGINVVSSVGLDSVR